MAIVSKKQTNKQTKLPYDPETLLLGMKVTVRVAQSCLTLCNPMDYTVHGIFQARILE